MNLSASAFRMRALSRHLFMVLVGLCSFGLLLSDSQGVSPATVAFVGTKDFVIDSLNKREVLAFYHTVYEASEGFDARSEWTGNVVGLNPGTTSAALKNDTLRRVNFYRALVGLPADVALNSEKSAKAQQAALIIARNGGLSHLPALEHPEWFGLKELFAGVEASAHSNLSLGAYGPAAVDGQMRDDGDSNWQAGHRRWLLSPLLAEIGAGDVPAQAGFPAANAIWVSGGFKSGAPAQFVAWPSKGYVPAPLLPKRWSLSFPGADFGSATVAMSGGGAPVAVRILSRSDSPADNFQGEKTLVWEPAIKPVSGREDVVYKVWVTGIRIGGGVRDLEYTVVSFDPEVLGESVSITRSGGVSGVGGSYAFNRIERADSYELTVFRGSVAPWIEGAEGPEVQVLAKTSPSYAAVQSRVVASGRSAFQLTHPGGGSEGFADQTLQLTRRLVPGPESVLQFSETGRFAEITTTLSAEVSADDGLNWTTVWSRGGVGLNSAFFDRGWVPHAMSLEAYCGRAVQIRFTLKRNGGPVAAGTTEDHGFFIDNILVTNGVELVEPKITVLSGTAAGFELNSATAGGPLRADNSYYLSVAPRLGSRLFPASPVKVASAPVVTATAAAAPAVDPVVIRLQPVEVKVAEGSPAVFSVFATGEGSLGYQWRKNGVAIPDATGATYRIEAAQKGDDASAAVGYDVVVTGGGGSVTSERVALTAVVGGAHVIENPSGGSVKPGAPLTLRVTTAEPEVTYRWRKDGVAIVGGTGATHVVASFAAGDAGRYDVVLKTWAGEVVSSPAYVGLASKIVPVWEKVPYSWVTLAGNGLPGSADGVGLSAQFNNPSSIARDGAGNLYVADTDNHVIRMVTQTGVVTTVAGSAGTSGSTDGSAKAAARFDSPAGIAVDKTGAVYVAEPANNTIRKLTNPTSSGNVTTIAGVAGQFGQPRGLNGPSKVAVDANGTVYFMDLTSIRRVDYQTQFSLLFGELLESFTGAQPAPLAIALDGNGTILAAANVGGESAVFSRLIGGSFVSSNYGPYPFPLTDLSVGPEGRLYAATDSTVQLLGVAGGGAATTNYPVNLFAALDGQVTPRSITVDSDGMIFAVDPFQHKVMVGVPSGMPVFILQPNAATVATGTLSAAAIGEGTVKYQWFCDGVLIPGATGPSYSPSAGEFAAGAYSVEATNSAGTVASTIVSVQDDFPPQVTKSPESLTAILGNTVSIEVGYRGPLSTTLQWYRNGAMVVGGTSRVLTFPSAKGSDAGDYRVVLRAGPHLVSSGTARLTVNVPVSIFDQPEKEVALPEGDLLKPFILRVSATGTPPLSYQWYFNDKAIGGATGLSHAVTEAGEYKVLVRNAFGEKVSDVSKVFLVKRPAILVQPKSQAFNLGGIATFSVSADGTQPLSFQWRKDGVPIPQATSDSLVLERVGANDAGFYDVLVSNALGVVGSRPVQLEVNLPPKILVQPPASISAAMGASVSLGVVVGGTGPFSYQWYRNGNPIPDSADPTYVAPTSQEGISEYKVRVRSSFFSEGVESEATKITVTKGRGISLLRSPAPKTNIIRGTAAALKLNVDPDPSDAQSTTYKLVRSPSLEVLVSGGVSGLGEIDVPLKGLTTSGSYKVLLSRRYKDGELREIETHSFTVDLRTLESAAGTYELLLNDVNGLVGDGANYRGVLLATVSRTGAVSGRVLYNEAPPLLDARGFERAYTAVVRSFNSSFVPSATDPSRLVCAPRLGTGTQANRQSLELELDFSTDAIELNASVSDRISAPTESDACLSQGFGAVRGMTSEDFVADFGSLAARYALGSDVESMEPWGPGDDNNLTICTQVLKTGKLLWTSRASGSSGSGSATLSKTDSGGVACQLYQARTLSSATTLSTSSLLGQLMFERTAGGTLWNARLGTSQGPDQLERQSCYIAKNSAPVYLPDKFDVSKVGTSSFNWSSVRELDFRFGTSCRWTGSTSPSTSDIQSFFSDVSAGSSSSIPPLELTVVDPVLGGSYRWTILLSPTGTVRTVSEFGSSGQPVLTLRLDKIRGEWTGSFTSLDKKTRFNLVGVPARFSEVDSSLRGAGWVEAGAIPSTRTGFWKLKLSR